MNESPLDRELTRMLLRGPYPDGDGWRGDYVLPEDCLGFSGHFPQFPLLPAFIQIRMAEHLLRAALKRTLRLDRISTAKFVHPARPGDMLTLTCVPAHPQVAGEESWQCRLVKTGEGRNEPVPIAVFQVVYGRGD